MRRITASRSSRRIAVSGHAAAACLSRLRGPAADAGRPQLPERRIECRVSRRGPCRPRGDARPTRPFRVRHRALALRVLLRRCAADGRRLRLVPRRTRQRAALLGPLADDDRFHGARGEPDRRPDQRPRRPRRAAAAAPARRSIRRVLARNRTRRRRQCRPLRRPAGVFDRHSARSSRRCRRGIPAASTSIGCCWYVLGEIASKLSMRRCWNGAASSADTRSSISRRQRGRRRLPDVDAPDAGRHRRRLDHARRPDPRSAQAGWPVRRGAHRPPARPSRHAIVIEGTRIHFHDPHTGYRATGELRDGVMHAAGCEFRRESVSASAAKAAT